MQVQKLEPVSGLHPRALIIATIYNFLIVRPGYHTKLLGLCILHQKYITEMPPPLISTTTVDRLKLKGHKVRMSWEPALVHLRHLRGAACFWHAHP